MTETLAAGRYRIERALGHGGMAVVYLAHDEELNRPVAVKVLAEHLAGEESFRARFLQESRLASRLSHPNVVQVYDAGETEGRPYIVMEYVPGDTVAQRGKLPYAEAVPLALQACAGLQHAHNAGLVHRDVKPANLLVREDSVLKIADFGIAHAAGLTRLTEHGTVLGTAAYLSPEQAAGEDVTAATDIYSLGAVLYELLTGRAPYEFESLAELAVQQTGGVITRFAISSRQYRSPSKRQSCTHSRAIRSSDQSPQPLSRTSSPRRPSRRPNHCFPTRGPSRCGPGPNGAHPEGGRGSGSRARRPSRSSA